MTLYLEEEGARVDRISSEDPRKLAETVIDAVLELEGCPYECEVNLLLTDNQGIRQMNREFREIDRPTDVLSFPAVSFLEPSDFDFLSDELIYFNPESGELVLGDIAVSKEKIVAQAEEYGHSVEREYTFLIAHSMLHLLGYDHLEEPERIMMEARQKAVMDHLQILR